MATLRSPASLDDFLARVTDIAYQALLRRGLSRSFLDVELELWNDIRSAFPTTTPRLETASEA